MKKKCVDRESNPNLMLSTVEGKNPNLHRSPVSLAVEVWVGE